MPRPNSRKKSSMAAVLARTALSSPECSKSKRRRQSVEKIEKSVLVSPLLHVDQSVDTLRDVMRGEAELGPILADEEISEERKDIIARTLELVKWENDIEAQKKDLDEREVVITAKEEELKRRMILSEEIRALFKFLNTEIRSNEDAMTFGYLTERLQKLWSSLHPEETVTPKLHALSHMRESMIREGHAGREIETIEHVHRSLNNLWPKYASVQPISHRLFIIVSRFNARNSLTY